MERSQESAQDGLLQAVLESLDEGLVVVGAGQEVRAVNAHFRSLWSLPEGMAGNNVVQLFYQLSTKVRNKKSFLEGLKMQIASHSRMRDTVTLLDGRRISRTSRPLVLEETSLGWLWCFSDLSEKESRRLTEPPEDAVFRALFNESYAIKLLIEPESGLIVDANNAAVEYYGYSREALLGMHLWDINTLPYDEIKKRIGEALRRDRNFFVFKHRRADDSIRSVEERSTPVRIGGKTLLYSVITDVTPHVSARELLNSALTETRRRTQELQSLVECLKTMISKAPDTWVDTVSRSVRAIVGNATCFIGRLSADQSQVVTATCRQSAEEEDNGCESIPVLEILGRARQAGRAVIENAGVPKGLFLEGREVQDSLMASPIVVDGKTEGFLILADKEGGFSEDDAKVADIFATSAAVVLKSYDHLKALERSQARYRQLFESLMDGYAFTRILREGQPGDSKFLLVNPSFEKLLGVKSDEILGRPVSEVFPDLAGYVLGICERVIQGGEPVWEEGPVASLEKYLRLGVYAPSAGFLAIFVQDITERKRMEDELTASLIHKDFLLREVQHRVRNNLQIISSLLHLQASSFTDTRISSPLFSAVGRVRSISMVHNCLRYDEGRSSMDLAVYLRKMTEELNELRREDGMAFEIVYDLDPFIIDVERAVPAGLVLYELLINVFTHAYPLGGDRKPQVFLSLKTDKALGGTLVEVKDLGQGIPEDVDLDNPGSLGLRLAKALVERQLLAGITIASVPGEGTRCSLLFPREALGQTPIDN